MRRTCRVTYLDRDGAERAAEVDAATVYEAAVHALYQWHRYRRGGPAHSDMLTVTVTRAHEVRVADLLTWLWRPARTPDERTRKERLRYLMSGGR